MAIFASTTLGTGDPSRAMSIKALEARAQALAAAQAKQELPTSMPSPWQGAGYLANTVADAFATKRADQQAAEQKQQLATLMGGIGPEGPNPQQLAGITARDEVLGKTYLQQQADRQSAAYQAQIQKERDAAKAQTDLDFAQKQETLLRGRPQTEGAKIEETVRQGQQTPEQAAEERKKAFGQTPAEQKAAEEAQNTNIDLQSTVAGLKEAQGLLKDDKVYSSGGAEYKETAGKFLPDALGSFAGINTEKTKATQRYNQLVSPQVLDMLSKLKGASSDRDMMFAINTLNDKSADIETKKAAVATLIAKSSAHLEASNQRLQTTGAKPIKVETGPAAAAPAAASDPVVKARAAIAAGAPRDAVIKRLQDAGIDTGGL